MLQPRHEDNEVHVPHRGRDQCDVTLIYWRTTYTVSKHHIYCKSDPRLALVSHLCLPYEAELTAAAATVTVQN